MYDLSSNHICTMAEGLGLPAPDQNSIETDPDDLSSNHFCAMADVGLPAPDQNSIETDPVAFQAKQADLIKELRSRVQKPPLGEFSMQDLVWTDQVTNGKGKYKTSKVAVIFWDRLDDFIQGEQHHPLYPCKFTKETIRVNGPNTLRKPRANSPALLVRFVTPNIELTS